MLEIARFRNFTIIVILKYYLLYFVYLFFKTRRIASY